jgi:glycosyltransferase involved in cell wall biosynthesis
MAKISVITPCYNSSAFLEKTIQSVLAQDFADWELILVDDGSTDATPEMIHSYSQRDARIRGVAQPNAGRARACNLGGQYVSPESDYLFFLDSDDLLVPSALRTMSGYLDAHPEVGLLGCQFQEIDPADQPFGEARRSRWVPGRFFPRQLRDEEYETPFVTFFCATGQGPFAMYRKSVFQKTAGWSEEFSRFSAQEDTDMFCQMALIAPVHYLPERLYLKRVHGASITQQYERIQASYTCFRAKWDNYLPADPRQAAVICAAKRHYYRRHKPLRDLKVAVQALKELLRQPTRARLCWFLSLTKWGIQGLILGEKMR